MSKEKPIIFSGEMVRAILEDRKIQTRRVINPQPPSHHVIAEIEDASGFWSGIPVVDGMVPIKQVKCPYEVGMHLWVRETWRAIDDYNDIGNTSTAAEIKYRADGGCLWKDIPEDRQDEMFVKLTPWVNDSDTPWRPSIFMFRWASRILLEILNVQAEQLQSITPRDAEAEGVSWYGCTFPKGGSIRVNAFAELWDSINGKKPSLDWKSNPWVWKLSFKVLEPH